MSEQDNGAEATISEEEVLPEGIDDPMVLKAELAKKDKAIRQIHARAIKAETLLKERTEKPEKEETIINNPGVQEDERLELRLDGYSKDEVGYIMANGGRKSLEDKNSYTAIAINTRREQLKAEEAASQTSSSGLSDVEKQVNLSLPKNPSVKDLKGSVEAMEKVLPHAD